MQQAKPLRSPSGGAGRLICFKALWMRFCEKKNLENFRPFLGGCDSVEYFFTVASAGLTYWPPHSQDDSRHASGEAEMLKKIRGTDEQPVLGGGNGLALSGVVWSTMVWSAMVCLPVLGGGNGLALSGVVWSTMVWSAMVCNGLSVCLVWSGLS